MIVTIDGPSGTGKSTIARQLARKIGFTHFDTGAMYRALTYAIYRDNVDFQNPTQLKKYLEEFTFNIHPAGNTKNYFVGDENVTEKIRTPDIDSKVSVISAIPAVREAMVSYQKDYGHRVNAVFEGRDLGTVVFPDAEVKIFLTADPSVRAKRRYDQLKEGLPNGESPPPLDKLTKELIKRDEMDSTRKVSPLRQANDAVLIDTTHLSIPEVLDEIVSHIEQRHS